MPSRAQRSASQVPGEDALHRDDDVLTIGGDGAEERFRGAWHLPMQKGGALLV